jgi:hypothetical protein
MKDFLKGLTVGSVLVILTVLYVLSAYFILHTTWIYENPNSYLNDHNEYYALLVSVAFFFLFLPFGVTAYYYKLMKSGNALSALIKGIFSFLSINAIADFSIFSTDYSQDLSFFALFFVFVLSPSGILCLWTYLDLNQKTMTYSQHTK